MGLDKKTEKEIKALGSAFAQAAESLQVSEEARLSTCLGLVLLSCERMYVSSSELSDVLQQCLEEYSDRNRERPWI